MRTAIAFLILTSLTFGQEKKAEKETPFRYGGQDFEVASGQVVTYGEARYPYFALSRMPEEVDYFYIGSTGTNPQDRLADLVLFCADRGLEVVVFYRAIPIGEGPQATSVFDVRVKDLDRYRLEKLGPRRPAVK